jgi:hypothetical protein
VITISASTTQSSDATLYSLSVSPGSLSPSFSSSTTSYSVSVANSISSITISASPNDSRASVSGTGNKSLNVGSNSFPIIVTAENGSQKTYTVNVTRAMAQTVSLRLADQMQFNATTLITNESYQFSTIIKNDGNASWSGKFILKKTENGIESQVYPWTETVNAGSIKSLIWNYYTPTTSGTKQFKLYYQNNSTGEEIPVPAGSYSNPITVIINDPVATLLVSPPSYNFVANGGTSSTITITSNQSWSVSDDASWLTTSIANGSNNSTFTMTATANTSTSSRSATVTITGGTSGTATVTVTQDGLSTYTIIASAGTGGTISPNGSVTVGSGESKTFTATPNSGKEVDVWKKNGSTVQTGGTSYTVSNVTANTTIQVTFKDVSAACEVLPLLTTYWAQRAPYNNLVVSNLGDDYPTGCVATAMAQIMNYWKHPIQRTRSIPSYITNNLHISVPAITGTTTYDWANMKNTTAEYTTSTQENAVAKLMYECGVAVHMNYEPLESGASALENNTNYSSFAAFPTYFGYDNGIQSQYRGDNNTEWENLLRSELNAGRPILYIGYDPEEGGHAFVCDGYSCNTDAYSRRYFHFNWGWGEGYQDNSDNHNNGYFVSSVLNIGGYAFNNSQGIVYNIKPNSAAYIDPTNPDGTNTFAISANALTGGYIIPEGIAIRYAGENQPLAFAANSGYEIDQVFIDGTPDATAKANGYHIFSNITANHSIIVTFKASSSGIEDIKAWQNISVFPNPTKNEIFIKSENTIEKVEIYTLTGALLKQGNNFNEKISVSELPQGIYLLKVYTDKGVAISKIVKE